MNELSIPVLQYHVFFFGHILYFKSSDSRTGKNDIFERFSLSVRVVINNIFNVVQIYSSSRRHDLYNNPTKHLHTKIINRYKTKDNHNTKGEVQSRINYQLCVKKGCKMHLRYIKIGVKISDMHVPEIITLMKQNGVLVKK